MYTILIVEDDERIADKLRSAISKYDFNVRITEDFSRVIDILRIRSRIWFCWTSICRNSTDSIGVGKSVPNRPPIIFISARDSGMDQIMAWKTGGRLYYEAV